MRKMRYLVSCLICSTLLAGCAETPREAIVREKGNESMKNYREDEQKEMLSQKLEVPEIYEYSYQSEDGKYTLNCQAKIQVPDTDTVSVFQVQQLPFEGELIDRITEGFFGDTPVYDGVKYFQMTKDQIMKKLEELKGYQAEGNLDPYGYIKNQVEGGYEGDPDEIYSLQEDIDNWEAMYESAPQTTEKTAVMPSLGYKPEQGDTEGYFDDRFIGAVEMNEEVYRYQLKRGAGDHMNITVNRIENGQSELFWSNPYTMEDSSNMVNLPKQEKAQEMAGITQEEAVTLADTYIKRLGLEDFSAKTVKLSLGVEDVEENIVYKKAGYLVSYTRDVQGVPVTDESNYGAGLESMESTLSPWGYEKVSFLVNQDGLQNAEILNLYQIGDKETENVSLKKFSEIAGIFETMMPLQYQGMTDQKNSFEIHKVTLGYMRIYDPGADNTKGLLVPVWDFFGNWKSEISQNGENYCSVQKDDTMSFLTINAIDGTVINRSLGY